MSNSNDVEGFEHVPEGANVQHPELKPSPGTVVIAITVFEPVGREDNTLFGVAASAHTGDDLADGVMAAAVQVREALIEMLARFRPGAPLQDGEVELIEKIKAMLVAPTGSVHGPN